MAIGVVSSVVVALERSHIDNVAKAHVAVFDLFEGLVDILNVDYFNIWTDAMLGAKIEYLLGVSKIADERSGHTLAVKRNGRIIDTSHWLKRTDDAQGAVALQ